MMSKNCYDIHHNLAIDYVNGKTLIGPCCQSGRITVNESSIDDYWNNPQLQQLRTQTKLDPQFCNSCIAVEAAGGTSRRQSQFNFYRGWDTNKTIRGLDIKLGNLCNLKCTICGPESSTAWIADAKKLGQNIQDFVYYDKKLQFELADGSALHDLEMIHFWGGEPLIDDKHIKVLEFLDTLGILANCRVTYNTYGTHKVKQNVLDLWAKAKLVEIYFSIDDIGHRFEYQRYPAKWGNLVENLNWYTETLPPNHLFYIVCTVSYLNIWYLPELIDWKNSNFNSNRLGDYTQLTFQPASGPCSVSGLSTPVKKQLIEKFAGYLELDPFVALPVETEKYLPNKFIEYVSDLDNLRNTKWSTTFKEFGDILYD